MQQHLPMLLQLLGTAVLAVIGFFYIQSQKEKDQKYDEREERHVKLTQDHVQTMREMNDLVRDLSSAVSSLDKTVKLNDKYYKERNDNVMRQFNEFHARIRAIDSNIEDLRKQKNLNTKNIQKLMLKIDKA